jgi:DNA polymerase-3 subunit beta
MKFTVEQEVLSRALTLVGKGISTRATLPALSGVLMDLEEGILTLTGNNTEIALRVPVPVQGDVAGMFLAPARLLTEFISSLPKGTVTIETTEEKIHIKAGKNTSDFTGLKLEEYPELSFAVQQLTYAFPSKQFVDAVDRVSFAASGDDARAILTGVSIKTEKGQVEMAATDGFRLSVEKFQSDVLDKNFGVVVPAKVIIELGKTMRESSGENAGIFSCALSQEGTQLVFNLPDGALFMTRLLEGSFPPYNKIIPTSYATKVVFAVDELLRTVRTAALFARSGASVVKMQISSVEKSVTLLSATEQVGEYSGEIPVDVEGSDNTIAFNSKYLLDFLGKTKSETVILELNGANQPGVWRLPELPHYLHVIMPVRVD